MVHLEKTMDLATMEQGIKLVGTMLVLQRYVNTECYSCGNTECLFEPLRGGSAGYGE